MMGYRIGSFNIQKFGRDSVKKKDLTCIANIIRDKFDIVAIQEISNKEALKSLLEAISEQYAVDCRYDVLIRGNKEIGTARKSVQTNDSFGYRTKHWEGRWAKPNSRYGGNEAEGYAFIWNRDRIRLVTNQRGEIFEPRISEYKGSDGLVRPPLIGRFMPPNSQYEIRLINTHIAYATPSKHLVEDASEEEQNTTTDQSDFELRQHEFDTLVQNIYMKFQREIKDTTGHDKDPVFRIPYTFLLGDYNLNLSYAKGTSSARLGEARETIIKPGFKIVTVNAQKTSIRKGPRDPEKLKIFNADPCLEHHLANNYDHFSYDDCRLMEHGIACPAVGTIIAFEYLSEKENSEKTKYDIYRDTVSDHLPIYLEFDVRRKRN